MKRFRIVAFFLAVHLVVVASVVTLVGAWLYGADAAAYAGWTGGFIVAVWTLPLTAFAGYFVGPEVAGPPRAAAAVGVGEEAEAPRRGTDRRAPRG